MNGTLIAEKIESHRYKDEILKTIQNRKYAPVLEQMDTRKVVPHLLQYDTISALEMDEIEEAGDHRKRAEKLLYFILSKNAENNFTAALRQTEYKWLADHLTSPKGEFCFVFLQLNLTFKKHFL